MGFFLKDFISIYLSCKLAELLLICKEEEAANSSEKV